MFKLTRIYNVTVFIWSNKLTSLLYFLHTRNLKFTSQRNWIEPTNVISHNHCTEYAPCIADHGKNKSTTGVQKPLLMGRSRPSWLNCSASELQTVINLRQSMQKQNLFPKFSSGIYNGYNFYTPVKYGTYFVITHGERVAGLSGA